MELGAAVVCIVVLISPMVRPSEFSHFVMERGKGRGFGESVCVCIALVLVYNWRRFVPVFPILLLMVEQLYLYTEHGWTARTYSTKKRVVGD